jgi:hypothetical protein
MGGDRELVMFSGLLAGALIFSAQEVRATVFGIALWFGALFALRLMAKSDPKLRTCTCGTAATSRTTRRAARPSVTTRQAKGSNTNDRSNRNHHCCARCGSVAHPVCPHPQRSMPS